MNDLLEVQEIGYADKNDIWQNDETITFVIEFSTNKRKVEIKAGDNKTAKSKAKEKYGDIIKSCKKKAKPRALDLFRDVLPALDRKDRTFYRNLSTEAQKEFSAYVVLRYISSISGNDELQNYYLQSTNYHANKHMWHTAINKDRKHEELQWLMLTCISPNMGNMRHTWLAQKKVKSDTYTGMKKDLAQIHPNLKDDDLTLLAKITTKKQLKQYKKDCGDS